MENLLGKAKVDCVKGDDEIFVVVDFLECRDHAWLAADVPDELLVGYAVVHAHAFLVDEWQAILMDSALVFAVEAEIAVASLVAFSILGRVRKTYKPSSQEYISSAYFKAFSLGIAPLTMAKPSLVRSSRKSPKCLSVPSTRMGPKPCKFGLTWVVSTVVAVVDMMGLGDNSD